MTCRRIESLWLAMVCRKILKEQGEAFRPGIPYFLYVGNTKPHKNVGLLIRVFAQLADQTEADLRLVTRPTHALRERIEELRIQRRVHFHQSIDDAALAELYRGAIALVLPSHYEGFGLPLVEAMACGCPVDRRQSHVHSGGCVRRGNLD